MKFYDLSKQKRVELVKEMGVNILDDIEKKMTKHLLEYVSDDDTYIRKNAYLILGRSYRNDKNLRKKILKVLDNLLENKNEKVRQSAVYAFGEIGKIDAKVVLKYLERSFTDPHHSVRNAVIGSLKQMSEKNPKPTIEFVKSHLDHPDPKVRRELVHGVELRGRTYPQDILPILRMVQNEQDKRVKETIIHVLTQISYKPGCLETVVTDLKTWNNQHIVRKAIKDILDMHKNYSRFCDLSYDDAYELIKRNFEVEKQ